MNIFTKRENITFCLLILFIFSSCLNKSNKRKDHVDSVHLQSLSPNENLYVVDLDKGEKQKFFYLSNIFKKVQLITLEDTDNSLIGYVSKLIVDKNYIFVLDKSIAKSLFVFRREDGKFIRKIGTIGQGPGEYRDISDFTVDREHDIIYIMDSKTQRISWFDIDSGKYIKSVKIKNDLIRSFHIQYLFGKMYADAYYPPKSGFEGFLLRTINISTGEQEECWMKANQYNKGWKEMYFGKNIFLSNEADLTSVRYNELFMDTVVALNSEKITPYLTLKSKNLLRFEDLQKMLDTGKSGSEVISSLKTVDKIYGISDYLEFGKYIFFYYYQKNNINAVLYNKETRETQMADGCIDDFVFKPDPATILPNFYCADKKGVYGIIQPHEMNRFLKLCRDGYLSDNISKSSIIKNLTEASNPVLFYYEYEE